MKITSLSHIVMDDFTAFVVNIQYKCQKTNKWSIHRKHLTESTWNDVVNVIKEFIVEDKTTTFSSGRGTIRQIILNQFGYVRDHEISC
jgi:hypothetical protein